MESLPTNKKEERKVKEIIRVHLGMEKLPSDDYETYVVHHYRTKEGRVISEYINKQTKILERETISEGDRDLAETVYDSTTGEPKEAKRYDQDGKVVEFIDGEGIARLCRGHDSVLKRARNDQAESTTAEERMRLMELLLSENKSLTEERNKKLKENPSGLDEDTDIDVKKPEIRH